MSACYAKTALMRSTSELAKPAEISTERRSRLASFRASNMAARQQRLLLELLPGPSAGHGNFEKTRTSEPFGLEVLVVWECRVKRWLVPARSAHVCSRFTCLNDHA